MLDNLRLQTRILSLNLSIEIAGLKVIDTCFISSLLQGSRAGVYKESYCPGHDSSKHRAHSENHVLSK